MGVSLDVVRYLPPLPEGGMDNPIALLEALGDRAVRPYTKANAEAFARTRIAVKKAECAIGWPTIFAIGSLSFCPLLPLFMGASVGSSACVIYTTASCGSCTACITTVAGFIATGRITDDSSTRQDDDQDCLIELQERIRYVAQVALKKENLPQTAPLLKVIDVQRLREALDRATAKPLRRTFFFDLEGAISEAQKYLSEQHQSPGAAGVFEV